MNVRLRALASELGCRVGDTSEQCRSLLAQGRSYSPRFHLAPDYVHPGEVGHIGIAMGVLRGLGYTAAAEKLSEATLPEIWKKVRGKLPDISWQVRCLSDGTTLPEVVLSLVYSCNLEEAATAQGGVELKVPEGWLVESAKGDGAAGEFILRARSFSFKNVCVLMTKLADGRLLTRELFIAAPWMAGTIGPTTGWGHIPTAPPEPPKGPLDEFAGSVGELVEASAALQKPPQWTVFLPTVDYTGQDDPGNIDFYGVSHPAVFETGYASRIISSEEDRDAQLKVSSQIFAGKVFVRVWLNGEQVYNGLLSSRPSIAGIRLRKGRNELILRSSHINWQWQQNVSLEAVGKDTLEKCRVSLK
jgi:hypothetical protein